MTCSTYEYVPSDRRNNKIDRQQRQPVDRHEQPATTASATTERWRPALQRCFAGGQRYLAVDAPALIHWCVCVAPSHAVACFLLLRLASASRIGNAKQEMRITLLLDLILMVALYRRRYSWLVGTC